LIERTNTRTLKTTTYQKAVKRSPKLILSQSFGKKIYFKILLFDFSASGHQLIQNYCGQSIQTILLLTFNFLLHFQMKLVVTEITVKPPNSHSLS
jgi:hypothetical protein